MDLAVMALGGAGFMGRDRGYDRLDAGPAGSGLRLVKRGSRVVECRAVFPGILARIGQGRGAAGRPGVRVHNMQELIRSATGYLVVCKRFAEKVIGPVGHLPSEAPATLADPFWGHRCSTEDDPYPEYAPKQFYIKMVY